MAHAIQTRGWSAGRMTLVAILAIVGVLAVIAGIMYLAEPARSLPGILGTITQPASRANAHRALRGWVALAIGVICLAATWPASRIGRSAPR